MTFAAAARSSSAGPAALFISGLPGTGPAPGKARSRM
jgi:hypothetical protein